MTPRFEPHCHSMFSNMRLLDAINRISDLASYGQEIGLKGFAITDHGTVAGWVEANQIQQKLDKENIDFKIALGEEGYLVDKRENGQKYYHCIWIAKDKIGAKQIRRMSSIANLNSYYDRGMERVPLTKEELEMIVGGDRGHIIVTTACIGGEVSSNILEMESARKIGDVQTAETAKQNIVNFLLWAKWLFGEDLYLEVAPAANKEQIIVNKKMVELSQAFNIKMVLGSDAHYLKKEDRFVHEAFLNSKGGDREVASFYEYAYLQNEEEIKENLTPSIVDMYDELCKNSMEIFDKIEKFSLAHPQQIPHVEVEDYPKPEPHAADKFEYSTLAEMLYSDDKVERYWINKCLDKLKEIDKYTDEYLSELEEEAQVKKIVGERLGTNMFSYPVTLSKYIDRFWELGSPVGIGRGSACSALNHYLLGITQLDPLEWDFPFFRYMNRDTDGLGDIDLDLAPSKVGMIISDIKKDRGSKFNSELKLTEAEIDNLGAVYVCTYGTESSKSAILTSCRGYRTEEFPDGIDVDTAQYLSSLVPVERGFVWSVSEVYYGNPDKDRKPVQSFIREVDKYPGLLKIMLGVEGMISRKGRHASGVLFLDEDPYEFNAYMKTPSGEVVTQWDLHMAEWAGSTKFDLLVTSVEDKILQTIKFLQADNIIEPELSLKEAYDKYLHPDVLPIKDKATWEVIQRAGVLDLFQLDSDIGRQGAKKIKPDNMLELSSTNGLIRLMNAGEGQETWLDKYVRFKNDRLQLLDEVSKYHLEEKQSKALGKYLEGTYGIGISQEQMMKVLMDPDICNFSLKEANKARKVVSKKKMSEIPALKEKVYETAASKNVADYVWDYVVAPGLGYAFSDIHSLSYSYIGFQTAYLATHWNPIYWNTSCLVVNSGTLEEEETEDKKAKGTDYAKVAKAIGAITAEGIDVSLVNINTSDYGFKPDVENNRILYGLKALSNISDEVVEKIFAGRPYAGLKDFMTRCPLTKTAMINLIKAGAFDEIDTVLKDRKVIMAYYISQVCEPKKRLTLQNFNSLIQHGLVPKDLELEVRVYNFNKYLKTKKVGQYYSFDNACIQFFDNFLSDYADNLEVINGITCIKQTTWDKIYKSFMELVKEKWLTPFNKEILDKYNQMLFKEVWDKYAAGTPSKWEMDSVCFYHGPHELADVDFNKYGIKDFKDIPNEEIDYIFKRGGHEIPIYKIYRIAGTVLAKNDTRHSLSLLTTSGVVNVKMSGDQYATFKRQVSQLNPDGTKTIIEKSWFGRGNKLVISGYKRDNDQFVMKTYKNSGVHSIYHIDEVVGEDIKIRNERLSGVSTIEEEEYE